MNEDVVHGLAALEHAGRVLAQVSSLPAEIGARIRWTNGTVWRRVGGNEWQPEGDGIPTDYDEARRGAWTAPSSHIAESGNWTPEPDPIDPDADRLHLVIEDDDGTPFLSGCECDLGRDHYLDDGPGAPDKSTFERHGDGP